MKKLAVALLLATLAGSSALAQSFNTGYGTGNVAPDPKHPGQQFEYRADQAERSNSEAGGGYSANAGQTSYAQSGQHYQRTLER